MPNPILTRRLLVNRPLELFPGPTPDFWLDAGRIQGVASGGAVATWPDASPNGRDFTQGTGANQPTLSFGVQNNRPAVNFGVAKYMSNTSLVATKDWTLFFVTQSSSNAIQFVFYQGDATNGYGIYVSTTQNIQVRSGGTTTNMTGTNTMAVNVPVLWTARRSNGTPLSELWVNQIAETLSSTNGVQGTPSTTGVIGAFAGGTINWGQYIFEAIGYSIALPDEQRGAIERYLRNKYKF